MSGEPDSKESPDNGNAAPDGVVRVRRADAVFDALLELEPDRRTSKLTELCGDDVVLRGDVVRLLRAHDAIGSVFDTSAASVAAPLLDAEQPVEGAVLSRYRLVRRLGFGGMGDVWLATDAQLQRDVAIKIVRDSAEKIGDRVARVRAIREARAVARLDHANVAGIYDVGETPDGALWFAMPFMPGGSLADRLRDGPLPSDEVMRAGRQLAAALAAAHAHGIVHRDVKPANAMVDAAGHVRLGDFGIAKLSGADTELTRGVLGTLSYVSPEQICGEPVDARSDLWSLGVTLYELATGVRPFAAPSDAALLRAIVTDPPAALPSDRALPPQLTAVLLQLLNKEPAARPESARAVERLLEPLPHPASTTPVAPQPTVPGARSRTPIIIAGIAALALLAALVAERMRTQSNTGAATAAPAVADSSVSEASVAVLPFENTGRAEGDEPFVDGLTEEVITVLGREPRLRVTSRTSAFALRGKGLNVRQMADTLGVSHLLEASVRRDADQLRVSARLIRASDGLIRWSEEYDRKLRDVFSLQSEIAQSIASALLPRLSNAMADSVVSESRGTPDLDAYEQFLEARYQRARRTPDRLRAAVGLFKEAIRRDSTFARAWGGLATTYILQSVFAGVPPRLAMPRAREAALRAIALDSTAAEGYVALAHLNLVYDFDWTGVEKRAARAKELDPTNESVRVVEALAFLQTGHIVDARLLLEEARARDALDPGVITSLGRVELAAGRVPQALALFDDVVVSSPDFAYGHEQRGYALLAAQRTSDALRAFRLAATLSGATDSAHLGFALARTGDVAEARAIVERLERSRATRQLPTMAMAVAHAGLGDADRAFAWLARAWTERAAYLDGVSVMPGLAPLSRDARWEPFLARMGLAAPR